jgi:hypothetical protein
LLQRRIRQVVAPELAVRRREAGIGRRRADAVPDIPLVHLGGLGEMTVPLVETSQFKAGRGFRHRVRRRIVDLVEVMLLLGEIADEGRAAQDRPPSAALRWTPRS